MIRLPRTAFAGFHKNIQPPSRPFTRRAKLLWTIGNLLMLVGAVALLYAGGLYANDAYGRYAARGDTDVPVQVAVMTPEEQVEPAPFTAPMLNTSAEGRNAGETSGQIVSPVPHEQLAHQSMVTRVVIPSIGVDSKVVEVGWDVVENNGQQLATWQVAKYAVGQHRGSANPGEGGNIVLAGHVGGFGKVFKDLFYVKPGEQITLYSNGQQYLYTVKERLLVNEEGVSAEQHAQNAQLIAATNSEMITLITCWPPKGPDKFKQRVVIQATPFAWATPTDHSSSWTIR